jgi:Na+/H+ antiporter NhaD/arsenite permease-like protein
VAVVVRPIDNWRDAMGEGVPRGGLRFAGQTADIVPMNLSPESQHLAMWIIFAVAYIGIALGRFPWLVLDRTGIAVLGAIAMLLVQGISIPEAAGHIDYETLLLLWGLMVFSGQLRVAGFYVWAGGWLANLVDRPGVLLAGIITISAALSALLANDIVCLAFTPLLCSALLKTRRDPIPYLIALATSSNIGSAATIIGNPQNMYIGAVAGLPFGHFLLVMVGPTVLCLGLCWGFVWVLFRNRLIAGAAPGSPQSRHQLLEGDSLVPTSLPLETQAPQRDPYLIAKTLILLTALVGFFLFAHGPGASERRAIATLVGAGLLLCSHRAKSAKLYQHVDWNLILLFLGLFVLNGAMAERGLNAQLFAKVQQMGVNLNNDWSLAGVTVVLSNLVSNVPAVLLLSPAVGEGATQAGTNKLWYLLAMVSTYAGNLTLVSSIANLIVAESASAFGVKLDLKTYCLVGIPLTIVTVLLGTAWVVAVM